jgi:hypothetical protein
MGLVRIDFDDDTEVGLSLLETVDQHLVTFTESAAHGVSCKNKLFTLTLTPTIFGTEKPMGME